MYIIMNIANALNDEFQAIWDQSTAYVPNDPMVTLNNIGTPYVFQTSPKGSACTCSSFPEPHISPRFSLWLVIIELLAFIRQVHRMILK